MTKHETEMQDRTQPDELFWLAFRYAADELSLNEAEQFEELLADDQQAREALAEAVQLGGALATALHGEALHGEANSLREAPTRSVARIHGSRLVFLKWASAAAAICLAVVLGVSRFWPSAPSGSSDSGDDASLVLVQEELALCWVQSANLLEEAIAEEAGADLAGTDEGSEDTSPSEVTPELEDDTDADPDGGSATAEGDSAGSAEDDELDVPSYYSLMAELYAESDDAAPDQNVEPRES